MTIPSGNLDQLVAALVAKPAIPFTGASGVPTVGGVYAITTHAGDCVHVGASQNLYRRMRENWGGGGNGADGDLIQKVQDGGCADDRHSGQNWMARHCGLRWLEILDPETRSALELRLKSVLQPKKRKK